MLKTDQDNATVFLATTALDEFCDYTQPTLVLGEWCLRPSQKADWEGQNFRRLTSPWETREEVIQTTEYINTLYETVLKPLGSALNEVHGADYSDRFWRIVVGPWLYYYLSALYDRYCHLKKAISQCPHFNTIVLDEADFVIPQSTDHFMQALSEDPYNLQIFTKLLAIFDVGIRVKKRWKPQLPPTTPQSAKISFRYLFKQGLKKLFQLSWFHSGIYCESAAFSKWEFIKLFFLTKGKLFYYPQITPDLPSTARDCALRGALVLQGESDDPFLRVVHQLLPQDLPTNFMEGFVALNTAAQAAYPFKPKAILSNGNWHYNDAFKLWAATQAERGVLLLGSQHGGRYGSKAYLSHSEHELAILDRFYSWGWHDPLHYPQVEPLPSPKLDHLQYLSTRNAQGILYVTTSAHRYLRRFPYLPEDVKNYLAAQQQFIQALSEPIRADLLWRAHPEDYGWDFPLRWARFFDDVVRDDFQTPFQKRLAQSRLYVCDHFSTTYLEALVLNKPTLLFWDPQTNEIKWSAKPYFDALKKVGILHDDPGTAADVLNQIYQDIPSWWKDAERQAARIAFCEQYARQSSQICQDWYKALRCIV